MPLRTSYLPASPMLLYDGFEENWIQEPWPLPEADGTTFPARLSRDVKPLEQLAQWLSREDFRQLLRDVGAEVRDWSGQGNMAYLGASRLQLHFVRHGAALWVLAAGELQPARYQTWLHGRWSLPITP